MSPWIPNSSRGVVTPLTRYCSPRWYISGNCYLVLETGRTFGIDTFCPLVPECNFVSLGSGEASYITAVFDFGDTLHIGDLVIDVSCT